MKKPSQKSRIRNPEQTRERLLQATIQLISEKGIESLSLKEVAQVANISRAAAYQHFESREHLLAAAKEWVSDQLYASITKVKSTSMDENVYHVTKLILENSEAARLFAVDILSGNHFSTDHPLYKMLREALAASKASGDVRKDIDDETLSSIMLGMVFSVLLSRTSKTKSNDKAAERFTKEWTGILRHGIFNEGRIPK
mgnify:CR=1 FL=1